MTPNEAALDFLSLCWGVTPISIPLSDTMDDMIDSRSMPLSAPAMCPRASGDHYRCAPLHVAGKTNFIKVERVL